MDKMTCPLADAARRWPTDTALDGPNVRLDYRSLDARVRSTASWFAARGIRAGDRVAMWMRNSPDFVACFWALLRLGCVAVPLNRRWPSSHVLLQLERTQSRWLVCSKTDDTEVSPGVGKLVFEMGTLDLEAKAAPINPEFRADQPSTIIFTSGSTDVPSAALHSFGNHYFSALGSNENIPLRPGDRWLLALPLYHVGGLAVLFRTVLAGAAVVLPGTQSVSESVRETNCSHVSLVYAQLRQIVEDLQQAPASLRGVLVGGSAVVPELAHAARTAGFNIFTTYGLTEMASQVSTTAPDAPARELASSGRVLPHREVRLDEDGEILVRGRTLFLGYVEGSRIVRPLDADGWFHTGDLGRMDADGLLHVTGRRDNMFVTGGENVQPEEIESAVLRLKGIERCVVVPVRDDVFGARPVAFVFPNPENHLTPAWREVLKRDLAGFKIPDHFLPWPVGDENHVSKVDRKRLKRLAATLLGPKPDSAHRL